MTQYIKQAITEISDRLQAVLNRACASVFDAPASASAANIPLWASERRSSTPLSFRFKRF